MFGLSVATELFQGSTERTWNCVLHFIHLLWTKLNHIRQPIMPRSRKRHHSHSRSRSRSHDRSRDREEKHRKNDSHEKDRDGKRRKIESYDSPQHKRSVSSEPDSHDVEIESPPQELPVNKVDQICKDTSKNKETRIKKDNEEAINKQKNEDEIKHKINEEEITTEDHSTNEETVPKKVVATGSDKTEIKDEETIEILDDDDEVKPSKTIEILDDDGEDVKPSKNLVIILNKDEMKPSKEGRTTIISKLEITPKKVISPKQLKRKAESEKKRLEKQKEKEERERKRMEERERIQQEKLKKKEEKQKELEQKQKEKEMKEEQRKKEREEKEELKKREREEKEQKRKEKEEQKRKEREEKLKKQLEIEEKNKEKQREEEKKQKAAAAFVNFFVTKKTENLQEGKKTDITQPSAFMAFQVKSDMKLPPPRRRPLSEKEKETLMNYLENQDESASYIKDLKSGKQIGTSVKTWPFEEVIDDDVTIIEDEGDLGETIFEDKSKLQKFRAKCLKFDENRRPAYFGTWRKKSNVITPRRPFAEDKEIFNYEEDSGDDWEEEEQGESLNGSDDEVDKENEDEKDDYEVDNEFFVPHGHLSDDEIDDEETSRLSPESLKQKLKLLKDEFEHDMQSKTHKLKPRSIGCIWYNKDGSNVEEAINRYLQPLAMISRGQIEIKKRSEILISNTGARRPRPTKELKPEHIPMFLKVIHGNTNKKRVLVEQFMTHMANSDITIDVKKTTLAKHLKKFATWRRCKKNGPMKNKFGWFVNEDVAKEYSVDLTLPNILESDKK